MPPKKSGKQAAQPESHIKSQGSGDKDQIEQPPNNNGSAPSKRKQGDKQDKPVKEPRVGERRSARGNKREVAADKLLNFLLTPEALALSRPPEERDAPDSERTYSSSVPMTPFEELLCAVILSRPISHRLGERSIRTILNGQYKFRTPKAIKDAGPEKRLKAFYDARTQHKDKTAEQIGTLANVVIEKYADGEEDTSLERLRNESGEDIDALADILTKNIKGVGKTAVDIFLRRIQGHWAGVYPYVDQRTSLSLDKLGLPEEPEALQELVDKHWSKLNVAAVEGDTEEVKKRMVFVTVLERAVGTDLEGNSPEKVLETIS